jgi:hypothetical protein
MLYSQAKDAVFTTVKPLVHGTVSLLQKLREQPGENLQKAPELIESLSELNSRIRQPTEKQLDDFSTQVKTVKNHFRWKQL